MALVTFPDVPIQSMSMRLRNAVSISESPFSFAQQVYRHQGSRWEAEVTLSPLTYTQAKSFQTFLAALQGQTNTFQFGNPLHDESFDVTTTAGTSPRDTTVSVSGDAVPGGNYFQLGGYMHITIGDFAGGTGTITVEPPIRESINSGTALAFTNPKSTWRMTSNDTGWDINTAGFHSFSFSCTEAL